VQTYIWTAREVLKHFPPYFLEKIFFLAKCDKNLLPAINMLSLRETCTRFWWESQKKRDHLEDQGVDGRMGSEWILGRLSRGM
jgi:hypothetical protein